MTFTTEDLLNTDRSRALDWDEHLPLCLSCIAGKGGLQREIHAPDINRPGLALMGYFAVFAANRIQLFGRGETDYVALLEKEHKPQMLRRFFEYEIPCVVFTHSLRPIPAFLAAAEEADCPVLQTELTTPEFSLRLLWYLSRVFAPRTTVHGVLVEMFGVGALIMGDSGAGKSEAALELIERGHILVADDVVMVRAVAGAIYGSGRTEKVGHFMEVRGIGIINVARLFGTGSVRHHKRVQMIVHLENGKEDREFDRLGNEDRVQNILGVDVPRVEIPVMPGRNIPVIIETAVMNQRMKSRGYYATKELIAEVKRWKDG